MLEAVIPLKEKQELEMKYGLHIHMDSLKLACDIVVRYSDAFLSNEGEADGCSPKMMVLLQKKAVELLHGACARMRHDLDVNVEENSLDEAEYLLYRTLLELNETKREKDLGSQSWIPRVEEEYVGLRDFWDGFAEKWKPLLMQQGSAERAREIFIMEQLRSGLVSYLQEVEPAKKSFQFSSVVLDLSDDLSSLFNSTCKCFKENATVKPFTVAEVASHMISAPASWLLNSSKPPLQGIGQRLRKRFGGQDHVIDAVTNALLRCQPHESGHRPIGSFLFFGGAPYGRPEFIEALTEELFDSKDLLVRFEMSDYSDSHCSQCDSFFLDVRTRDYNHGEHGIRGELIKVVKSRPFGVLLFENVEKANNNAIEILLDILRHGRLTDSQGGKVDFTNMLIIMTSDVVMNNVPLWCCDCLEKDQYRPMKSRLKHYFDSSSDHMCGFLLAYIEADKWFKSELLEELDDVVVFNGLSELQCHVIARLQLRELTEAMRPRRLIVYPSEAALRSITGKSFCRTARIEGMKIWLKENVVPVVFNMLSENKTSDGITTIYIDTLVGTDELSYRMEKSPVNFLVFTHFKESLNELRMMYKKEKEHACKIYTLKRKYFELITMDSDEDLVHFMEVVQDLVDTVDDIVANTDVNFMCKNYRLTSVSFLNQEAEVRQRELASERARNEVDGLQKVLDINLDRIYQAVDVVAEALLRTIHGPHDTLHYPAKSFLILGLTSAGKADLLKGLVELCAADGGTSVILINAEEHQECDSFLQLMDGALWHDRHEQHGLGLQEAVRVKQGCIILIDQIEKAHMSVFSTILSMLDHSTVEDSRGRKIDFRDTVVAIISDLGNRPILSRLAGHAYGGSVPRGRMKQDGRPFRTELLNRVDETLIFNPFAEKQLKEFSRLSMRVGRHLEGEHYAFFEAFFCLFNYTSRSFSKKWPWTARFAVSHLSKELIGKRSNIVLVNRGRLLSSFSYDQVCVQPSTNSKELIGNCSSFVFVSRCGLLSSFGDDQVCMEPSTNSKELMGKCSSVVLV
ncbi:uncharacterized protein LOC132303176 [Cornus florida]|uniref:uncharacterized protein LOC132303176 n=1 Tax=Cornus florida TaxID=4283 RepID=UPI002897C046|nr:uncharacterized protein LOC132303176 [Cornus florida]XP_059656312.1 uncharacterized protein LOC132303176 [Cornus florida]XP_059656313.1 uncharacterized protein LOC132303176 [Cornus florida]